MRHAVMGKIMWVDLGRGTIEIESVPDDLYAKVFSGVGLAAHLLYERIPGGADPLGPDNVLGFVSGLLTATGSLFTGRWMVTGKSPLTGGWGDANCGGNFSPAIKRCGVDGIFFSGISPRPVYFWAAEGRAELRDAADLWGRDTFETETLLQQQAPDRSLRVACIGPAGEKKSLIAGIANDRGRMAARAGLGAVMGAKRLKAVVLGGGQRIPVYDREAVKVLSRRCNESVQFDPPFLNGIMMAYTGTLMRRMPLQMAFDGMLYKLMLDNYGTTSLNQILVEVGDTPIKNWKGSNEDFNRERSEKLSPEIFTDPMVVKYHCYSCPLGCGGLMAKNSPWPGGHKPEYESVMALGGLLLNDDAESIFRLNDMLNRAGMDTISAGGTVALAMECYEKGLLTRSDTDGLDLSWGNSAAIVALVGKMIRREGIGELLADGARVAARKIGRHADRLAMHAGGQELGMHDGRYDPGFALHYSVEPTPGRHTIGSQMYYEMFRLWEKIPGLPDVSLIYTKGSKYDADEDKIVAAAACSRFMNVLNGSGTCLFGALLGVERLPLFEWLNAATGWQRSPADYMAMGERIQTLKQAFNIKHGIAPKSFKANPRTLGIPPPKAGANAGRSVDIDALMRAYWRQFGWDPETGRPGKAILARWGIHHAHEQSSRDGHELPDHR
ncbi:MAG: aldehyde ferredoxin oxidoreductase family protein [Desulfobacterales bacterium]